MLYYCGMRLFKYTHACVRVDVDGTRLLIDPGTFTSESAAELSSADAVLITHDHFDHFDAETIAVALRARSELEILGPAPIVRALADAGIRESRVRVVAPGDEIAVGGVRVDVLGGSHAPIHEDIPVPANLGYLIAGAVYHPGDSYFVPSHEVHTLLVPTSGPWTKMGEAIEFVRAVRPRQIVPIHDVMLSDIGRGSNAVFLGADRTGAEFRRLEPCESLEF